MLTESEISKVKAIISKNGGYYEKAISENTVVFEKSTMWDKNHKIINIVFTECFHRCAVDIVENVILIDRDVQILEITKGHCPYRQKKCDGLCNNCGVLVTPEKVNYTPCSYNAISNLRYNGNDYECAILARQDEEI